MSKLFMNAITLEDSHFRKDESDLKGHERLHKTLFAKLFLAHSFINRF